MLMKTRKPREHPDVLSKMDILVNCIQFMPYTGSLFTSQMPFFPVSLIGLLAYRDDHRQVLGGELSICKYLNCFISTYSICSR
jgi:hypothetical protein